MRKKLRKVQWILAMALTLALSISNVTYAKTQENIT